MLDEFLIRHCAPTLAGLKTGNLFWYPWKSEEELAETVHMWKTIFQEKGLGLMIMRNSCQRVLLYVYRTKKLDQDLMRAKTRNMLEEKGYCYSSTEEAIFTLRTRIQEGEIFPHEIGLFLGYPEEDVKGFIENHGKNCKCCGCWKVYCNECDARKTFRKLKKCQMIYEKLFLQGRPVKKMIVAAKI